jgi:hypothetical protein
MPNFFEQWLKLETDREVRLKRIEEALARISIAGSQTTIVDYEPGKYYKRNTLVVDPGTETVYRTIPPDGFISTTIDQDKAQNRLKLVGYESQFVTFDHAPIQDELDALPEDVLVAIYSSQDDPYTPALSTDNVEEPSGE